MNIYARKVITLERFTELAPSQKYTFRNIARFTAVIVDGYFYEDGSPVPDQPAYMQTIVGNRVWLSNEGELMFKGPQIMNSPPFQPTRTNTFNPPYAELFLTQLKSAENMVAKKDGTKVPLLEFLGYNDAGVQAQIAAIPKEPRRTPRWKTRPLVIYIKPKKKPKKIKPKITWEQWAEHYPQSTKAKAIKKNAEKKLEKVLGTEN